MNPLTLEPKNGDFVQYLKALEEGKIRLPLNNEIVVPITHNVPYGQTNGNLPPVSSNPSPTDRASSPMGTQWGRQTPPTPTRVPSHSRYSVSGRLTPASDNVMDTLQQSAPQPVTPPTVPSNGKESSGIDPMFVRFLGGVAFMASILGTILMSNEVISDDYFFVAFIGFSLGGILMGIAKKLEDAEERREAQRR